MTDSVSHPSNKIAEIQTEYSQIVRVLAAPLPEPSDSADESRRLEMLSAREQQLRERERFILRYQKAIKAFLGKKLHNPDKVDEVWDFFMHKCLAGKLSKYEPAVGSFRKYLKTVLRTTCYEFARNEAKDNAAIQMETGFDPAEPFDSEADVLADAAFNQKLIETIFHRALEAIKNVDTLYYKALKLITEAIASDIKPPKSEELAIFLSAEGGKMISKENARTIKSRSSKLFAKQIILEVSELIGSPQLDEIENALIDIGILRYCKKALQKMRAAGENVV